MSYRSIDKKSGHCRCCGKKAPLISQSLGLYLNCIREDFSNVLPTIEEAYRNARSPFNLPKQPPGDEEGLKCQPCVKRCRISPNTASDVIITNVKTENTPSCHHAIAYVDITISQFPGSAKNVNAHQHQLTKIKNISHTYNIKEL